MALKGDTMKRNMMIIFSTALSMLLLSVPGKGDLSELGERIKHAACEKACERTYQSCMKGTGEALNREGQGGIEGDVKDVTREETCQYAREQCLQECP
jgi:hypothetical protein